MVVHKRLSVKPVDNTTEAQERIGHVPKLQRKRNAKQWCVSQDQQCSQEGKNKIAMPDKFCFIDEDLCKWLTNIE
jgi:hypothetical protein